LYLVYTDITNATKENKARANVMRVIKDICIFKIL
jgi:hypothetical protein